MMIQKSVRLDSYIPISNSTDLLRRLFRQHRPTTDIAVNSAAVGGVVRTRARVFRALRQAREPLSWVDVRNIRGPEVRMHAELARDDRSGQSGSIERNEMLSSVSSVAGSQQQYFQAARVRPNPQRPVRPRRVRFRQARPRLPLRQQGRRQVEARTRRRPPAVGAQQIPPSPHRPAMPTEPMAPGTRCSRP